MKYICGKSGSTKAGSASLRLLLTDEQPQLSQLAAEIVLQIGVAAKDGTGTSYHHDVISGQDTGLVGAVQGADAAPHAVALDGVAQLHPGGNTQTAHLPVILPAIDDKIGGHGAFSLVIQAAKLVILL